MESNNELKEIDVKNSGRYYFNDIIKMEGFDFNNIVLDEKSHRNILLYCISYKNLIDAKPLDVKFNKADGFIRVYNGVRYLVLLGPEKYDAICNRITYLICQKSGITSAFSDNCVRIKIDSSDSHLEKTLTLHNFIKCYKKKVSSCYYQQKRL